MKDHTRNGADKPKLRINKDKHWDDMVALPPLPAPHAYVLCHSTDPDKRQHYIWKGNNDAFYSPPFDDAAEGLRWPETNLFKLHTEQEVATKLSLMGAA